MVSLSRHITLACITGLALLCLAAPVFAADGRVQGIRYDAATRHFQIDSAGSVKATVNTLNIAGHKRIIIDMDNAEIGTELPRDVQILHDLSRQLPGLKNITVNQYAGNGRPIVRILMDIQGDPGVIRLVRNQGPRIELELNESANTARNNNYAQPPSLSRLNTASTPQPVYQAPTPPQNQLSDNDLRRTLSILNQKYETLSQENQYLKARLSNAEQGQSASQSNQQREREEQNRLKADIERLKTTNGNLQSQLNGLLSEKHQPDPALASKQAEITRLKTENQALSSRLTTALAVPKGVGVEEMKQTLAEMNRRYDLLAQENQSIKSRLNTQSTQSATLSASKTQIERLTQENQSLKSQLESQNSQSESLSASKTQVERLTQDKQSLAAENSRLKTALANQSSKTTSASASDADLQALRKQVTVAQGSLSESIRTINEQNKEIAYLRNQVGDVKAGMDASSKEQVSVMQTRLDEKDASIRELRRQLSAKTTATNTSNNSAEVSKLKKQLDQLSQQYETDSQSLNRQLKAKNEQLLQSGNQNAEIARLKSAVQSGEAAQKELAAIKTDLDKLKKASASIKGNPADKEAIARLTQEKQALRDEIDGLKMAQQQSTTGGEKTARLESQVASLETDLSSLKSKYEQALKETAQAQKALQAANTKSAAKTGSPAKTDASQQPQIASLNQQLSVLRKENASLRESLSATPINRKTSTNSEAEQDYNIAKAELSAKKIDTALEKFKEALLLDPDNSKYAVDYSITLAEDRQYAEAIDVLRRYLQRNPGDRDAYNQLGKIYLLNDQPDAANQAFTRAIPISVLNNYATSLKKLGSMADAESVFKLALTINPKDSEVLFNLGNLYNSENKLEQARNKYLEALQARPDFAEAHYNLGLIFSKLGDNAKAVTHLEKFLQLSPNARNAETIRAYMQKLKA